jgi:hypothetical protein
LPIGEVMSIHPRKDTTRNRVCKHTLALEGLFDGAVGDRTINYTPSGRVLLTIPLATVALYHG